MFISKKKYEKLENEISDLREELRNCKRTNGFLILHKKDDVCVDVVQQLDKNYCTIVVEYLDKSGKVSVSKENSWIIWNSIEVIENNKGYAIIKVEKKTANEEKYFMLQKGDSTLRDITLLYKDKLNKVYEGYEET